MEEGGPDEDRLRRQASAKAKRKISQVIRKNAGRAVAAIGVGLLIMVGGWIGVSFRRELLIDDIERRMGHHHAICLTPRHIGKSMSHIVTFGKASKYPRMIDPSIMAFAGREFISDEQSTMCPVDAPPSERRRREMVTVMYRSHPLLMNETAIVSGSEAICLQHMINIFDGQDPCAVEGHQATNGHHHSEL